MQISGPPFRACFASCCLKFTRSRASTYSLSLLPSCRRFFDEDKRPPFDSDLISSDIHCFSSLLKIYFGELPTPLFNSSIYSLLSQTIREENEMERLNAMFRVLSRLAPPYFRWAPDRLFAMTKANMPTSKVTGAHWLAKKSVRPKSLVLRRRWRSSVEERIFTWEAGSMKMSCVTLG